MKILTVVGARPQFIKVAAVSRELARRPGVREVLVHTGQHYDPAMSDVFFRELDLPAPHHHLDVGSGMHGAQTARMLAAVEGVIQAEAPDWVLVYGDTNSTLAGALAAVKLHVPVAHVEAGLRSFNRRMPEEINRVLTDHAADLLFAPTEGARRNLAREGVDPARVHVVGDVMYDVALASAARAERESDALERLGLGSGGYVLATIHRAENTDEPGRLAAIVAGLRRVGEAVPVVWPVHPRTREAMRKAGLTPPPGGGLRLVPPVGYLDMVRLERHAALVATDSGGVQKEAFFHGVPCVTLRDETEWSELVELGWNRLVPPADPEVVAQAVLGAIGTRGGEGAPYGAGRSAAAIVEALVGAPAAIAAEAA